MYLHYSKIENDILLFSLQSLDMIGIMFWSKEKPKRLTSTLDIKGIVQHFEKFAY